MAALRNALANRALARLLGAFAASALGSWAFMIALSLYAYAQGGPSAVGAAVVVRMAPSALAAPYGAMLPDPHSRRAVLGAGGPPPALPAGGAAVGVGAARPFALGLQPPAPTHIA